jgi:SAM-dependent methyltransferase
MLLLRNGVLELKSDYSTIVKMGHKLLQLPICYTFLQVSVGAEGFRSRFLKEVSKDLKDSSNVIDLGCGPGANRKVFRSNIKYVGIDLSFSYIEKARRKFSGEENTSFFCTDLTDGASWDDSVNDTGETLGLAFALWHHLSDEQISSVLKTLATSSQGNLQIISVDPIITDKSSKLAVWLAHNDRGPYLRTEKEFRDLYSANGFSFESKIYTGEMRIPGSVIAITAKRK